MSEHRGEHRVMHPQIRATPAARRTLLSEGRSSAEVAGLIDRRVWPALPPRTPQSNPDRLGIAPRAAAKDVNMSKQTRIGSLAPAVRAAALAALAAVAVPPAFAQVKTELPAPVPGAKPVTVEHIKVHSAAIAGNLEGESADREVIVFLPPGYDEDKSRR